MVSISSRVESTQYLILVYNFYSTRGAEALKTLENGRLARRGLIRRYSHVTSNQPCIHQR